MLSFLRPRRYLYSPLDQVPEHSTSSPGEEGTHPTKTPTRYAIWIISICAILDTIALTYLSIFLNIHQAEPPISLNDISLRSTYVGLDELYLHKGFKSIPRGPINNLPILSTQVDASKPNRAVPPWRELRLTARASVQFNDRRFFVSPQISTIVQLHAVDYGMENCSITLTVPPSPSPDVSPKDPTVSPTRINNGSIINIFELSSSHPLDTRSLSWATKPSRKRHIGAFPLTYDTTLQLPGFYCGTASYMNFEMACAEGSDCLFESYADKYEAVGLYIRQYQTI